MTTAATLRSRRQAPLLVDGEYPFTLENFRTIAQLLRADSGIHLPDAKATLVYARLAKRVRALGLESFDAYCALVASAEGADERRAMMAALTTNVTRFYREPHHFEHLRDKVLAPIAERIRAGGKLRLWSSACSTGQEPYSIALTVLSVLPEAPRLDVRILATDIDPNVVETARKGVYSDEAASPVPKALRDRYMKNERTGQWRVGEEARSLVAFKTLNLIGEWPMKGRFDAIFCRNVVIYFDEPTQNTVWAKFKTVLQRGGRLYVGHSERVDAPGYRTDGLTVYLRDDAR
jgi:chemotaxis protein methyltransferase CheR